MLVRFTKGPLGANADTITCVRTDGSATTTELPRQGVLPHLAIHFVIENTMRWHDALFGRIADGHEFGDTSHNIRRANTERSRYTQALQAESLVECLEAEQWGGAADPAEFAQRLLRACRHHAVPPPDLTADELDQIRVALREFGAAWRPLPAGAALHRTF